MIRFLIIVVFTSLVWSCQQAEVANTVTEEPVPNRLLIEFVAPDSANQARLFKQIDNIWKEVPDMQIEVVVHGPAIFMIQDDTPFRTEIADRVAKGAVFAACRNSIVGRGMDINRVIPEATVVPSAFVELAARQKEGWPYVKSDN